MDTILLHIRKQTRREALAQAIRPEHEISAYNPAEGEPEGDLLVLDYATYQRNGSAVIEAFKRREGPRGTLPVLLLVPSDWMSHLGASVWNQIDEVVEMPLRLPELKGRLQVLLGWRQSSFEARRHAERYKEKGQEAAKYKAMFGGHPLGTLLIQDGKIQEVNRGAERILQASARDLRGRTLDSLSLADQREATSPGGSLRSGATTSKGEAQSTWLFQRPGGEAFEAQFAANIVASGGETFVQVVLYDHHSPAPS